MERFFNYLIPNQQQFAIMSLALVAASLLAFAGVAVFDRKKPHYEAGFLLVHPLTFSMALFGVWSSVAFSVDVPLTWLCAIGLAAYVGTCALDRCLSLVNVEAHREHGAPVVAFIRSFCEVVAWVAVIDLVFLFCLCLADSVLPSYIALAGGAA